MANFVTTDQAVAFHETGSVSGVPMPAVEPIYDNQGNVYDNAGNVVTTSPSYGLSPNESEALGEVGIAPGTPTSEHLGGTTGTAPTDPNSSDAFARLRIILDRYGLGGLTDWLWGRIVAGDSDAMILQSLREQPAYKTRFAANEARRARGLVALSEAEIISYERTAGQMMRAAGLPAGFYDSPEDFVNFLAKDVSVSELQDRVQQGFMAATAAPSEVRDELHRLYGVDLGGLAAYYLDPDRALPVLQRQFASAQIGGASQRTGFGALNQSEAERLVALGVTGNEAQEGFGTLVTDRELFGVLPGEVGTTIGRDQQLGAVFEGNAAAAEAIRRKGRTRAAVFEGGGTFASGQGGISGLGSAESA